MMANVKSPPKRLLILASKLGYQTQSFARAAQKLGVEVVFGTDRCHKLDDPWQDGAIPLHFEDAEKAAERIAAATRERRVHAILALGDRPTVTAAHAAEKLGLPYNSPQAVRACRSKLRQREVLRAVGLPVPGFFSFATDEDAETILPRVKFPCVLKPLSLAASQGVIRADHAEEFVAAARRIGKLLASPEVQATRERSLNRILVEEYIPGEEVAVEGVLQDGRLRVLTVFDKPDPLTGPYFEETIYVTPSRLTAEAQQQVTNCARRSIHALDLKHGPVHAEFRVNERGPWVLEVAPRPIGGLCSRALRFGPERIFLEELLVRHALGWPDINCEREVDAAGVMMIPVPQSGIFEAAENVEEARTTPGVDEIHITARLHDYIAAWPEGSSYLGFIFARGRQPEEVVAALRAAHAKMRFVITPRLPVHESRTGKTARPDSGGYLLERDAWEGTDSGGLRESPSAVRRASH
jgi:biotin carboxylase